MNNTTTIAAIAIFVATYIVLAVGKIPVYRIDRAGAALLGASLMVGTGLLPGPITRSRAAIRTLLVLRGGTDSSS